LSDGVGQVAGGKGRRYCDGEGAGDGRSRGGDGYMAVETARESDTNTLTL